jgi:hypothetical protein
MPSDRLQRLEAKLRATDCPKCHHTLQSFVIRCDVNPGDRCVALARCERCGEMIDLDEAPTIEEEFEQIVSRARASGCRQCSCSELRVEYRCDLATRDCYYEAICAEAGHRYRL